VQDRFSLTIPPELPLSFVHLHEHAHLLEPAGSFSLLMESIGAMRLAYRGLRRLQEQPQSALPSVFVDTTGFAFTYLPAVLLFGCRVVAYVHYPTISTDMLQLVWERRRSAYNHQAYIAGSVINTYVKLVYYAAFAVLYGCVGSLATAVQSRPVAVDRGVVEGSDPHCIPALQSTGGDKCEAARRT
jgi:alpha-1,2-mannosyltransferase